MTKFNIGSGKSDSFFFNTANSNFIIKTLKEEECQLLVRKGILEKYYAYIKKNPCSMLARFYGVYTVNIKFMKPISVVIMDNLMGQHMEDIISIYDLKGSLHKRITKQVKNARSVKKDLNFLLETQFFMKVDPRVKQNFLKRLQKDKEFLKSCNLMDYSLLMIFLKKNDEIDVESQTSMKNKKLSFYIKREAHGDEIEMEEVPSSNLWQKPTSPVLGSNHLNAPNILFDEDQDVRPLNRNSIFDKWQLNNEDREDSNDGKSGGGGTGSKEDSSHRDSQLKPRINEFIEYQHETNKNYYYRLGIIDFLQAYTRRKQLETMSLRYRYKQKPKDCFSCVPPDTYGDRFYNFLAKNLFTQRREFPEFEIEKNEKDRQSPSTNNNGPALKR